MGKKCGHILTRVVRLKGSKVRRQCTACGHHFKWEKVNRIDVAVLHAGMDKARREKHKDGGSVKVKRHDDINQVFVAAANEETLRKLEAGPLPKDPTLATPHVPTRVELQAMTIASLKSAYPYLSSMPVKAKKDELVQRVIDTETQVVNA